jgi:hypothetical protein
VDGLSQTDGTVVATRVEVTGLALIGRVRSQGAASWQVDETALGVNATTRITGEPRLGDWVRVSARQQPDGAWLALSIAREPGPPDGQLVSPTATAPAGTSAATPATAAPTATPTPAATRTPPPASATLAVPTATAAPVEVRFSGVVESIGAQSWQIAGQTVLVIGSTEVRDNPQVGQQVEVRALQASNGTLTALRIERTDNGGDGGDGGGDDDSAPTAAATNSSGEGGGPGPAPSNTPGPSDGDSGEGGDDHLEEQEWDGTLEAVNGGTWVIGGQAVAVNGQTEIRDNPQVGDNVRVRAVLTAEGWVAVRIERR